MLSTNNIAMLLQKHPEVNRRLGTICKDLRKYHRLLLMQKYKTFDIVEALVSASPVDQEPSPCTSALACWAELQWLWKRLPMDKANKYCTIGSDKLAPFLCVKRLS